jgi:hypothetical protein
MTITVECYQPIYGTPAELLWNDAWQSFLDRGLTDTTTVFPPPSIAEGWVGFVNGIPAGIQVVLPLAIESGRVNQLLSWVHPEFRQQGVFSTINDVVDVSLKARGYKFYISWVIAGEDGMRAAIEARGAVLQQYRYRRPIVGA